MDKIATYRRHIRRILEEYAQPPSRSGDVLSEVITDEEHDHYLLTYVGWRGNERVRGCTMHMDIQDGRIWIQHDGTETGLATELLALGVPKEDIVLGFRAPSRRGDCDLAAA